MRTPAIKSPTVADTSTLRRAVPRDVIDLCSRLREGGHRAWVVGGCVRDLLLHPDATDIRNDWDIATDALPERVQKLFRKVFPTGIQHGTVTVVLNHTGYEVTTLRGETTYTDGRRPDEVYFVDDIRDDLARRDFTVNAIAYDVLDERLIDPFDGQADLAARTLKAVGVASERFDEDGLRVLRAARFVATLEMELEAKTAAAIEPSLDTYRKVSPERIHDEWVKTMKARQPSRAFRVMMDHGLLQITCPELAACKGVPQDDRHTQDLWEHSLKCVDTCEGDEMLRHAALLHDVGEPPALKKRDAGEPVDPETHAILGSELIFDLGTRLRFSNHERDRMTKLVRHHAIRYSADWSDGDVRRFMQRVGRPLLADLLVLKRADTRAQAVAEPGPRQLAQLAGLDELERRVQECLDAAHPLEPRELAIGGRDLIQRGFERGPRIGDVLGQLLAEVVEDPSLNTAERLLERVTELESERQATS